jgi:hypothetical protein
VKHIEIRDGVWKISTPVGATGAPLYTANNKISWDVSDAIRPVRWAIVGAYDTRADRR